MKIIVLVFVFLAALAPGRAGTTVSVTQEKQGSAAADVERQAVALLVSCSYEAPSDIANEARWRNVLGTFNVRVVFTEPRTFSIAFSTIGPAKTQDVEVKEILIPVSQNRSPDYILVGIDDRIRAFAKYGDHDALLALQKCLTR